MQKLNGCHSKPRPNEQTRIPVQDGWYHNEFGVREGPNWTWIKHTMTTACQYSKSTPDPRCAGCPHVNDNSVDIKMPT